MKPAFKIIGRIAITLGTVGALGWGFVALNPPDENGEASIGVQESQADIFSMSFAERTSTQKFQAALDDLGHEKPRVYDYNGNTVLFSTNQMRGTLDEVFDEYMLEFAEEGVNPEVFVRNAERGTPLYKTMLEASVNGGVIPWVQRDDYMAMGGAVLDADVKSTGELNERLETQQKDFGELLENFEQAYEQCGGDPEEYRAALRDPSPPKKANREAEAAKKTTSKLCSGSKNPGGVCSPTLDLQERNKRRHQAYIKVLEDHPELRDCGPIGNAISSLAGFRYDDFTKKIMAYRSIEAWYNQKTGMTRITASWSDETFDAKKAQPTRYGGVVQNAAAKKIPLCPGCRRTYAFQGTGPERPYSSNIIISPTDPMRTAEFYRRKMMERGWEIPESELVVDELQRMGGKQSYDERWMRMRRGKEFLAIHVSRDDDGRTKVKTSTAP